MDVSSIRGRFVFSLRLLGMLAVGVIALSGAAAQADTKVTMCTNWFAEAEHGGFYQAKATGLYRKAGLDVTIKMGGPQVNGLQLLVAGQCDFYMGYPMQTMMAVYHGLPVVSLAASFQKDPQVLIAHPGVKSLADLKGKPILVSQSAYTTWYPWLEKKYGFTRAQTRPYTFSIAPFLHDPNIAMQGYLGSEPYMIEKAGIKPVIFLLADYGWPAYAETIVTRTSMVKKHPKVVAAFVKASMEGWKSYLSDPSPANKLIREADPKQTPAQMAFALKMMKKYRLVTGGEAAKAGIGIMTNRRWKEMFDFMVKNKMLPADFDYHKAYDLEFIQELHILPSGK